ncbi:hypothetical protein HDU93_001534 [Gonapodya sp. JEL0774]|nr:hypothetical protein HDU93_001534 [Gonapodya sp. JEL0774]
MLESSKAVEAGLAPIPSSDPLPAYPQFPLTGPPSSFPPSGFTPLHTDEKSYFAIMGGTVQKFAGRVIPKHIVAWSLMGGVEIDLRGGILQPGVVTKIECYSLMGGVHILAPPNMPVEVSGAAIMGGFVDDRQQITNPMGACAVVSTGDGVNFVPQPEYPPQPDNSSIKVTGVVIMGGASVGSQR